MFRPSIILLGLLITGAASGQNALDANLHANDGKNNPSATREDYRARNLVVTGDVAGGRGFRGNVGYTAEGDFRGATGGDSSIDFRRGSALSSPGLARSQSAGDTFSMMRDSGAMAYSRDYAGTGRTGVPSQAVTRQRLDQETNRLATEQLLALDAGSTPMARYRSRTGDTGTLTASTVRGIKRESDRIRAGAERLNLYEAARLQDDLRRGLLRMDAVRSRPVTPFSVSAGSDAVRTESTVELKPATSAQMSVERLGGSGSTYDAMIGQIRRNWDERSQARQRAKPEPPPSTPQAKDEAARDERPGGESATVEPATALDEAYRDLRRRLDGTEPEVDPRDRDLTPSNARPKMSAEEYALVLKHGTKLDAFGESGQDRLAQLIEDGQRALREGNNFVAEKRFEMVLILKPDDPRATAGLLHCQIGANLPGSASLTLRKLFIASPEMMDVTYGPEALPPTDRLVKALESAKSRMRAGRDAADYGLLVAYVGRLMGDRASIEEGLAAVKGTDADDTLAALLRSLWLVQPESAQTSVEPASAPNAEPPASEPPPATP